MKAIQQRAFGGVEVLEFVDIAPPVVKDASEQVIIEVHSAGVNFADLSRREGSYGTRVLPQTMGVEVAGFRADTGTPVLALLPEGGACAEIAIARKRLVFDIPADIPFDIALALFEQGITAHHILHRAARVCHEDRVVIHAAAGGVGSIAVQLARIYSG
jgi:NADPH:quinone reductase